MEFLAYPLIALFMVGIFTREVIAPASKNNCDRRWLILSASLGVATMVVTLGIGWFFSQKIRNLALFHAGDVMPDFFVGLVSFLLCSFIFYWWHRATHASDFLWRIFHQLHHSATRIEAFTAFYAHPLDSAAAVLISAICSYLILGASPIAAFWALLITGIFDIYVHSDIHTPKWVGYIVQRPEMHTVHHQYLHHKQNYGLPIWDMLFGTWCNPSVRVDKVGFSEARSARITDMLLWRDVYKS